MRINVELRIEPPDEFATISAARRAGMGVSGALVASALHDATLSSRDLAGYQGNR